jgi:non-specific serine/threonine protein kinase/serine/threonine-protein kinase
MALRFEPERRYASAAEFASDIERYLHNQPIIARSDSWSYRVRKFVARNRIAVAAAVVALFTLVAGLIATLREAHIARVERAKAEQRFNDVRKLANSVVFELHDAIEKLPGSTSARELIVQRALEYVDKLSHDAQDDQSLQRELVQAYIRVGNVQGNPTNSNLGDTAGALASYNKAADIARRLAHADPESQRPLALAQEKRADVLAASGDLAGALQSALESLSIFQRIAESNPGNNPAQQSWAISLIKAGDVLGHPSFINSGDTAGALARYRASLAIWEAQQKVDPSNTRVRRFVALVHERLGAMLGLTNDHAGALQHFRLSLAIRQKLAEDSPNDIDVLRDVAIAHEKIGDALTQNGDLAGALESRSRSLALFENLLTQDPHNTYLQVSLAISHLHMARLLADPAAPNLGRKSDALVHAHAALAILAAIDAEGANAQVHSTRAEAEALIARIH